MSEKDLQQLNTIGITVPHEQLVIIRKDYKT